MSDTSPPHAPVLIKPPGFVHPVVVRDEGLRKDAARLAHARRDAGSLFAPFWRGQPFVLQSPARGPSNAALQLALIAGPMLDNDTKNAAILLGEEVPLQEGGPPGPAIFAYPVAGTAEPDGDFPLTGLGIFAEVREVADQLSAHDAGLAALARTLLDWHRTHGFCARCGAPTRPADAGWRRACTGCDRAHFPRVDPVTIMLIEHDGAILLGRQPQWPEGFYSCLAGYVEPGETLASAARREAFEEAGVRLGPVEVVADQPWPYPSSLMIGVYGRAESRHTQPDGVEIEAVRWFSREEARSLLAGNLSPLRAPPPAAIAHHLIARWAHGDVPALPQAHPLDAG